MMLGDLIMFDFIPLLNALAPLDFQSYCQNEVIFTQPSGPNINVWFSSVL